MADINLKTETPDTTLPTTGFLFGADSQAASAPSVFTVQSVATTLLGSTTLSGATITADAPVLNMSQTWNNAAVTFTGLKFNAAGTSNANSAAASLLMDLQVGGASRFNIGKDGYLNLKGTASEINIGYLTETNLLLQQGGPILAGNGALSWSSSNTAVSGGNRDLFLTRRGAANLRLGAADTTGTTAPTPQFLSAQSWASSTTNNQTGANFTIDGSQGTGTGAGGSIIFRVAPAGATSNGVQNGLSAALTINSTLGVSIASSGSSAVSSGAGFSSLNTADFSIYTSGTRNFSFSGNSFIVLGTAPNVALGSGTGGHIVFDNVGSAQIHREGTGILGQRGSPAYSTGTQAQAFRVYNTFTDATTFERANIFWDSNVLKIGTEKGSVGGTARALEFQTDGTTRLTITTTAGGAKFEQGPSGQFGWYNVYNNLVFEAYESGNVRRFVLNGLLLFEGNSSSFPAIKRSSTTLQARLADDTAFASVQGKLTTDTAYTAGSIVPTGYLTLYDSTGTAYRVPCVV